jgi:hypothetical protein
LNNLARQEEIKQFVAIIKPEVICLQETKIASINHIVIRNVLGSDYDNNFLCLPASGTRGGVDCSQGISYPALESCNHRPYHFCNSGRLQTQHLVDSNWGIWPLRNLRQKMFIREIKSLNQSSLQPWVIIGDFNLIYKDEDKINGRFNRNLMTRFKKVLDHLEVKEIPLVGKKIHMVQWSRPPNLLLN